VTITGGGPLPYHKRWHSDMITEVMNLDLRERGALFSLVDLMFKHDGSVPDEDDFVRRYLGCNAKGWHSLRDRLIHLEKIYRDDAGRLRCPLVDKELKSIRKMRDVASVAGMISQAKRQMTSKVCPDFRKVSNSAPANPLETLKAASTTVQPLQTPDSRVKKEAPPSSLGSDVVAKQGSGLGEGEQAWGAELRPIVVSPYLAQNIESKWKQ